MPRILRQDVERLLSKVPEEYVFRCCDGRVLRDLEGLRQALASRTDGTFAYHSNKEKKDFSNWVMDVIGDQKLARDLVKSLDRTDAAKKVAARVDFLSAKLA